MFEADKITEKNKKQRFYEKGIYSKIFHRRFLAFALFAYGFFGFAGDFVGAKSSVSAYGENAGDVTAGGERSADNDGGAANFTNLIVFARFSNEEEFIDTTYDGVSVRQLIENTYTMGRYSVENYYYAASDGNVRMQNLYLFSLGGTVACQIELLISKRHCFAVVNRKLR